MMAATRSSDGESKDAHDPRSAASTASSEQSTSDKPSQRQPQHVTVDTSDNNDDTKAPIPLMRRFTLASTATTVDVQSHPIAVQRVDQVSMFCGLAAGVTQAAIFSPYDRALYLSVTHRTPFLSMSNFEKPFTGLSQSMGGRALSGGLYFPLEQFFMTLAQRWYDHDNRDNSKVRNFVAGTAAGAVNAMILNPLSAVKYKTWSRVHYNRGMMTEAWSMLQKGGHYVFLKGMSSTLLRDITFGGCYTFFRLQFQYELHVPPEHQWMANLSAAALATVVSGPFNLARNVQYATKSEHSAPTTLHVFQELVEETKQCETTQQKLAHVQKRLRIGWGTARVAMGMAFGHWVYDSLHTVIRPIHTARS